MSNAEIVVRPKSFLVFIGWVLFLIGTVMIVFGIIGTLQILFSNNSSNLSSLLNLGSTTVSLIFGCLLSITGSLNILAGKEYSK